MDKNVIYNAVDKFLDELYKNGKSEVVCPVCKTKLELDGDIMASYSVRCKTEGCVEETFRGI